MPTETEKAIAEREKKTRDALKQKAAPKPAKK